MSEPKPPPICAVGPSRPAAPPAPDRDRRGHQLHRNHAPAHASATLVEGVDHLVGARARALGLGREREHQNSGDEATQPEDDGQGPTARRAGRLRAALAERLGRHVAGAVREDVFGCELERFEEDDGTAARHESDQEPEPERAQHLLGREAPQAAAEPPAGSPPPAPHEHG